MFATTSFRWTLTFLALVMLAMGLVVAALVWRTNELLTGQALQVIAAEARGLNEQYRNGGLPLLVQTVNERGKLPGNGLYLLADASGGRLAGNLAQVPPEIRNEPNGGPFHYMRSLDGGSEQRLAVGMPIRVTGPSDVSVAHLIVARDIQDISMFAQATRGLFLTGMGVLSLLVLGGAALYSRRLLRRVDDVTIASQRIMAGDLTQRLPVVGTRDEMDRLAASLNLMFERIEQLLNGLREVSDNIAHDLKTPLTRLRNRAEAALRDPSGGPAYRQGLEQTLEEADELIKTFNALLSIARLEAGAGVDRAQTIDLVAIVQDTVELYEPVAEEAGLRIALDAPLAMTSPGGLVITADRQLIGQTLANLIENALKYGCGAAQSKPDKASNADITVGLSTRPGWVDVTVGDRGPGIPAGDRERVLKRFVRLESSRTLPGTGLGLSLVAAVARLHQGTVRLEDNAPGLRVIVSLPLALEEPRRLAWKIKDHNLSRAL
jgi:signal transduction histidine kinase